jgi:hypothetical protein
MLYLSLSQVNRKVSSSRLFDSNHKVLWTKRNVRVSKQTPDHPAVCCKSQRLEFLY